MYYDRKLKLLNSQTLAKEFDIDNRYLMEWTIGSHIYDGKLLLVTNDGVKSRTISPVINAIDLATMKVEPAFYVEKEGLLVTKLIYFRHWQDLRTLEQFMGIIWAQNKWSMN